MAADSMSPRLIGILAGFGAAAIWGGMYVVSKYALAFFPPLTLVLLRLIVGAATLGAIALATRARLVERRDLGLMGLLGLIGLCISMVSQFAGTRLSTAANGALITSATPAFLVLFAWPILGERLTAGRVGGLALATAGVAATVLLEGGELSFAGSSDVLLGNVLLVVAALTWALYSALARVAARRYSVLVVTLYATAFGVLFTGALTPLELATTPIAAPPALAWLGVLYLGVVSTAGAFYLWNKSIALLGAGLSASLFFAQPVVGGLLGAVLLGERLGLPFLVGAVLIGLAVVVTAREG
jgi:drug/metabolite transporter (DMT)-like permease